MDNFISEDELALLGMLDGGSLDGELSTSVPTGEPVIPPAVKPPEKIMSQADIDALLASLGQG